MSANPPRLFVSELTGKIYVVTRYRETADGQVINAGTKTDVTKDFEAIEAARAKAATRPPEPRPDN